VRLKNWFMANSVVSLPFGLGSVLAPHLFLSLFGATLGPAGALMMQYGGAWLIGIGLLTWFTRDAAQSEAGWGIARALLIAYVIALVTSVMGQLGGVLNVLGWMPVAIQAVFSAGLAYSLAAGQKAVAPVAGRT